MTSVASQRLRRRLAARAANEEGKKRARKSTKRTRCNTASSSTETSRTKVLGSATAADSPEVRSAKRAKRLRSIVTNDLGARGRQAERWKKRGRREQNPPSFPGATSDSVSTPMIPTPETDEVSKEGGDNAFALAVPATTCLSRRSLIPELGVMLRLEAALVLAATRMGRKRNGGNIEASSGPDDKFGDTMLNPSLSLNVFYRLARDARSQSFPLPGIPVETDGYGTVMPDYSTSSRQLRTQPTVIECTFLTEEERMLLAAVRLAPELYHLGVVEVSMIASKRFPQSKPSRSNQKQIQLELVQPPFSIGDITGDKARCNKGASRMELLRTLYHMRAEEVATSFKGGGYGRDDTETERIVQMIRQDESMKANGDPVEATRSGIEQESLDLVKCRQPRRNDESIRCDASAFAAKKHSYELPYSSFAEPYIKEGMTLEERVHARAKERERRESAVETKPCATYQKGAKSCRGNIDGAEELQSLKTRKEMAYHSSDKSPGKTALIQLADALWLYLRSKRGRAKIQRGGLRGGTFAKRTACNVSPTNVDETSNRLVATLKELQFHLAGAVGDGSGSALGRASSWQMKYSLIRLVETVPEWVAIQEVLNGGNKREGHCVSRGQGGKMESCRRQIGRNSVFIVKNDIKQYHCVRQKLSGFIVMQNQCLQMPHSECESNPSSLKKKRLENVPLCAPETETYLIGTKRNTAPKNEEVACMKERKLNRTRNKHSRNTLVLKNASNAITFASCSTERRDAKRLRGNDANSNPTGRGETLKKRVTFAISPPPPAGNVLESLSTTASMRVLKGMFSRLNSGQRI